MTAQIVHNLPADVETEESLDLILRQFNLVHAVNNSIVLLLWLARHVKFYNDN
jgi:hypothetical protein